MKNIIRSIVAAAALALSLGAGAQTSGNWYGVAIPSSSKTGTTVNGADILNAAGRGVHVIVEVTARTAGIYTPIIQGKNRTTGSYYTILTGTGMSSTGTQVLRVYPGITASANAAASDFIPYTWRLQLSGTSASSMTASAAYNLEQ